MIGDVVGSRQHPDQAQLFTQLRKALNWVNTQTSPVQALQITIGDELQGVFAEIAQAIRAALLLSLYLGTDIDLRYGLGWGELHSFDTEQLPYGQSGTAWWHARNAIEEVSARAHRKFWPASLRMQCAGTQQDTLLNSYLICRDELLSRMDARDRRIALGLFQNEQQQDIAQTLGISQPAVAKRQQHHGINALLRAQQLIETFNQ